MSLYLLINLLSISIPFVVSFDKRIQLMRDWKSLILALVISSIPYLMWDVYFTEQGYWGFNPIYLSGTYLFNLPIEEVLFFICIPFACIFTHISILKIRPFKLKKKTSKYISITILVLAALLLITNLDKAYTVWVMVFVLVIQGIALLYFKELLSHFLITFLFMLIPFIIVNGALTGFGIPDEVVWYNNNQNFGLRFITIPLEDFFYAYSLILLNLIVFKVFSKNQSLEYSSNS